MQLTPGGGCSIQRVSLWIEQRACSGTSIVLMKAATETGFRPRPETVQSYLFISGSEFLRKCDITIMAAAQEAPRTQGCIAPSVLAKGCTLFWVQ